MKKKLIEHILSILFVGLIFGIFFVFLKGDDASKEGIKDERINGYARIDFLNLNDPYDRALLKEVLDIYYPGNPAKNDSLVHEIMRYRSQQLTMDISRSHISPSISLEKLAELMLMYIKFILIYVLVLILTTYGVQTFASFRFIKMKQGRSSYLILLGRTLQQKPSSLTIKGWIIHITRVFSLLGKALIKGIIFLILFSPAYVIAYSFKTRFDTNSIVFMIVLGVISNGLLITYTHKFFTLLVTESRKGYVQTAIVKNLSNYYGKTKQGAISNKLLFQLKKSFPGHVFHHIFINARYQYLSTLKEQASFLITGLIIIEMALNIQGHLCYELLQNLLYKNYHIVLIIIFGIFLIVKATEIISDYILTLETRKYENR